MKYFAKTIDGKLFLCSRDIQVGDKVFEILSDETIGEEFEWTLGIDKYNSQYKEDCFKVIGEISPNAAWVKEEDEFEDYQLWCKNIPFWGNNYVMIQPHAWNEPRPTYKGWSDEIIKIKGPCGYYH